MERTCIMIFVPLLHYFKCKNSYSGSEAGMRYLLTPGKRTVPDPEGEEGADPWALDQTDPALRRREVFPLSDAGRAAAAQCMKEAFEAEPERWKNTPSILDCEPWAPPAPEEEKTE